MENAWLSFAIVSLSQLVLFAVLTFYTKRFSETISILRRGVFMGMVIGLLSDLLLGKLLGLWSYTLGFGALPLLMSAIFIYGLFASNILLLQRLQFRYFLIGTMATMAVYESANYFFRSWTYELPVSSLGLFFFLIFGYLGTAVFMVMIWHKLFNIQFKFINTMFTRLTP